MATPAQCRARIPFDHEQGALEPAEFISLDTCFAIMNVPHEGLADPKYRPLLLVKFLEAKWLGLKVGKSFYDYYSAEPVPSCLRSVGTCEVDGGLRRVSRKPKHLGHHDEIGK